jgi:prophage antirepressor-like protein
MEKTSNSALTRVFNFNPANQEIRVELINGEPWFVAKDVCDVLEHSNHKVAIQMLDEDEVRKVYLTDRLERQQETNIVSESGLYTLIIRSNKQEAKAFRKWVTSEVLPSIRRTGGYAAQGRLPRVDAPEVNDFAVRVYRELLKIDSARLRNTLASMIEYHVNRLLN